MRLEKPLGQLGRGEPSAFEDWPGSPLLISEENGTLRMGGAIIATAELRSP